METVRTAYFLFQHTAARRRLGSICGTGCTDRCCFNTQPPEGGWVFRIFNIRNIGCFNTQPPEGGWIAESIIPTIITSFNTQPPEGGWGGRCGGRAYTIVSTHSRPKAAGHRELQH